MRLDAAATEHLHGLAAPRTRRARRRRPERVPVSVAMLVEQLPLPAFVTGRRFDILAANATAIALNPAFTPGGNVLRRLFLDPDQRELNLDWDRATASLVGGLRERAGADSDDPQLAAVVGELSLRSDRFRTLWARAGVGHGGDGPSHLRHPQVGDLYLRRTKLDLPEADGLQLVVFHADPGTDSAQALALLGSLGATSTARLSDSVVSRSSGVRRDTTERKADDETRTDSG